MTMMMASPGEKMLRKLCVSGRLTTIRIERMLWAAFDNVCVAVRCSRSTLMSRIDVRIHTTESLTSAIRVFLVIVGNVSDHEMPGAVENALGMITTNPAVRDNPLIDLIAPKLTNGQALVLSGYIRHHPGGDVGGFARSHWGGWAPWPATKDPLAADAIRTLCRTIDAKRRT